MSNVLQKLATTLEEARQRAELRASEQEEQLAVAQADLAAYERQMGALTLRDDPNLVAVTLAARKERVRVGVAAREASKAAAAHPRLLPPIERVFEAEKERADLYRRVYPIDKEIQSLHERVAELRQQSQGHWARIEILTHPIEGLRGVHRLPLDTRRDDKLAAQMEAEANSHE